jgi:hypothetical protein
MWRTELSYDKSLHWDFERLSDWQADFKPSSWQRNYRCIFIQKSLFEMVS